MNQIVTGYLKNNTIAVVSIAQANDAVHAASLHFAHSEQPFTCYFITDKNSKKCASLLGGESRHASLVIGFDEQAFITLQADGMIAIVSDEDALNRAWGVYTSKFPDRKRKDVDADTVMLQFVPTWWRYRDYKTDPTTEISE